MTENSDSVFLTYVTYRDTLDQEHGSLCSSLRTILAGEKGEPSFAKHFDLLNNFMELLQNHHETENSILQVVCPEHWQSHMKVHEEIASLGVVILEQAKSRLEIDRAAVKTLLDTLENHIETLDRELTAAIHD